MLPLVDLGAAIEPFDPYTGSKICDPVAKPGVIQFRNWVMSNLGGKDLGIVRDCNVGNPSHHHEGRAWDWGNNVGNPQDEARVDELLAWLLAKDAYGNDAAWFRRVGLVGVIWNHRSWNTYQPFWHDYTGTSPHTDHVHFSFGWPGARGETSFYSWLSGAAPGVPLAAGGASRNWLGYVMIAGMVGYLAYPYLRRLV